MAEMKLSKGRKKKEAARATDDVLHDVAATPVNGAPASTGVQKATGAQPANGAPATNGAHAMNGEHRINGEHLIAIDENERRRLIAEAAYYRALRRGFTNGSPESDWLEAEAEIVALLANAGMRV